VSGASGRAQTFRDVFGHEPEAAADAPGRVNLLGDHTDYNDGFVLPTALPLKTRVQVGKGRDAHEAYSVTLDALVRFGPGDELPDFARYVGGCLRVLADGGLEVPPSRVHITSDVPVGAGLSSSAALEVAVLRAFSAWLGLTLDPVEIARLAQRAEIEHAGVHCGIMDQMAASLATPDTMLFLDTRSLERRLLPLPPGAEILVIDSGVPRRLSASAYNERRRECAEAARLLGVASLRDVRDDACGEALPPPLGQRVRHVVSENARVLAATSADAEAFGELMNGSHASLRDHYEVSIPEVDAIVADLQADPDVFGARMTGAGFGGACVALAIMGRAAEVAARLVGPGRHRAARQIVPPVGDDGPRLDLHPRPGNTRSTR
jgi:galactokinase